MSKEEKKDNSIEKLIQIVDNPCFGWKGLSGFKRLRISWFNVISFFVMAFYLIFIYYVLQHLLPLISEPAGLLAVAIASVALIFQFFSIVEKVTKPIGKEEIIRISIEWNYNRIKKQVEKEHWLLLKALILMKTVQKDFKLSEVRRKYPSLFDEESLVGSMLYGLSPLRLPDNNLEQSF